MGGIKGCRDSTSNFAEEGARAWRKAEMNAALVKISGDTSEITQNGPRRASPRRVYQLLECLMRTPLSISEEG